jgi:hypothetical protein
VSFLEYVALTDPKLSDVWLDVESLVSLMLAPIPNRPIDWKQETFIHRYMNYLDDVKASKQQ